MGQSICILAPRVWSWARLYSWEASLVSVALVIDMLEIFTHKSCLESGACFVMSNFYLFDHEGN